VLRVDLSLAARGVPRDNEPVCAPAARHALASSAFEPAARAVADLVAIHVGHRPVHRQQDLEVLRARVDVLRDDVHAGIQKLGDRAPLLGQVAPQARRVFCDDHGELFTARRPEQALVPRSFGSAPANGRVREALHDREAVALGQAAHPAVGY
jgi:hypothetical protein